MFLSFLNMRSRVQMIQEELKYVGVFNNILLDESIVKKRNLIRK
jgi:hypothetical protein